MLGIRLGRIKSVIKLAFIPVHFDKLTEVSDMVGHNASELRQRAEKRLREQIDNGVDFLPEEAKKVIHELYVHQIELELQNEELRKIQLTLETSQSKYSDLYEFSPIGLLTLDHEERIQEANLTFVTMLGIDRQKIIKRNLSDFIDRSTQDIYHFFYQALRSTQNPQQCEILMLLMSQRPLTVRLDGIVLAQPSAEGTQTTYRIAISDNTFQKQAETQRVELAAERQRIKVLADFVRDISHDLRTPITSITTGLYLITKITDLEKQREKIETLHKQLFYLARVLDQLQQMAVLDSTSELKLQGGNINHKVEAVLSLVKPQADLKQIKIIEQLQDDLPYILLHTDKIEQTLNILFENALQFTGHGGMITVVTYQDNDYIGLEISDNGVGIEADRLPHIFDHFFKGDESRHLRGGAGLGLPMAKRIIELHHGSIEANSIPGVKTMFRIKLPLSEQLRF
jgi:PAS domain S-box-containing protein